ncbi:MAG: alpha/beta fold hydrolase [Bacteroidetes bacterium]|jgi:dipeptidyl aminopeptidase/acylaminoacyl peptidase|nr:alpha/beta fold hydrolase [Bacteroidota bacterium]
MVLRFLLSALLCVSFFQAADLRAQSGSDEKTELTLETIFLEPVIPGIRPSLYSFSADQNAIYFSWNDSSYYDTGLYEMELSGSEPVPVDSVNRPVHSPNNQHIAYTKDGDLYVSRTGGSGERRLFKALFPVYSITWSPNSRQIAFAHEGEIWTVDIARPSIHQVTRRSDGETSFNLNGWAGNNALILSQSDFTDARTIYFPEYVDGFVEPGGSTRGIPAVTLYHADVGSGSIDTVMSGLHRSSIEASYSGRFVAIDSSGAALKDRDIILHDMHRGTKSILFTDSTDGWLYDRELEFAPGSEKMFFLSEQTGWNHLYLADALTGDVEQLTEGEYEITWAEWLSDNEIIYANNEADYGERHIFILNVESGETKRLTTEAAYRYQFNLSPDKSKLIYAKTFFNEPYELFMIDLENPGEEIQLTNSVPDSFYDIDWQREEYVRFTGRDGETEISMSVLYPENYDENQTYPVVVFAHGAGSLQNVYKGWSNNYWREYMFNQLLTRNGYFVIDVDFRHSTGYGRDFREDVTNWMGRYETMDIVDGLDWVQEETGGTLDLGNVGIYGGSYGGFMALYTLTAAPNRFHAGAALRKVTNWRNYYYANPWYTLPRLGDPVAVPEHYDRSSPLTYADELQHPVILLHGLIDDNVGAQDAFQYAEELIQNQHKEFEMMIYPSERHSFTNPNAWYDEYSRIFHFFEEHLK